ncbi:MAG: glucosidase, partial [Bryobacteraceae bacterium]
MSAERSRLLEARRREKHWRRWGTYVSERAWGTVREDYSPTGNAWEFLTHDQARSKAYRWGEDGLAGFCDTHQRLCLGLALWNQHDPFLKERLYGLTGNEGNHGEDVKEYYYYLDATPTYSYAKWLYKYPQTEYLYSWLKVENARRGKRDAEFELIDTQVFEQNRYFDVFVEYAKADVDDILVRITAVNRGPEPAPLHILPTVWFRNQWSWGYPSRKKPRLEQQAAGLLRLDDEKLGRYSLWFEDQPKILFTENETNFERLYGHANGGKYFKDAFHDYVVSGNQNAVNPDLRGTKACGLYHSIIASGESRVLRLRLSSQQFSTSSPEEGFDEVFAQRKQEADDFYSFCPCDLTPDARLVQRQAFAGLLWSKQYYYYVVDQWLKGDPAGPAPPESRHYNRNHSWVHFYAEDVLTMPDKWEYPWFAAWDTAFHMIPLSMIDPDAAKKELERFLREWYMKPNGQLPAY